MIMQKPGEKSPLKVQIATGKAHLGVALDDGDYYDGDIVEVDPMLATQLVNEGRAVLASKDAKVGRASRAAADKPQGGK